MLSSGMCLRSTSRLSPKKSLFFQAEGLVIVDTPARARWTGFLGIPIASALYAMYLKGIT